ncbi:hypothetical protein Y032_0007g3515 [Ancylostoma ceylanicum]|nr:hypothetical protein Y032_0007g3515 [Ancylostoma ceylanicum]
MTRSPFRSEIVLSKPVIILLALFLFYTIFDPARLNVPVKSGKNENWRKKDDSFVGWNNIFSKNQQDANIPYHSSTSPKQLLFSHKPETSHVECGRALRSDKEYMKSLALNRPKLVAAKLNMSCEAIKDRILPPKPLRPLLFGVAFARIVYKEYQFLERELRSSYHSQNYFCYSVDGKAGKAFSNRIKALSECLPNVIVTSVQFTINRRGRFMNHAFHECLKLLITKPGWQYVLLMQNHDVMIKSVYETVAILSALGGANDVHVRPCEGRRWNHSSRWDARSLGLYRRESQATPEQLQTNLTFARGAVHASLSRSAVDWLVNTVDLTKLMNQLNTNENGIDEVLIPSLQVSDVFDMPGRFTGECVKMGKIVGFVTRLTVWAPNTALCRSGYFRHSVCVFGIEDFAWVSSSPKLMANKMMPEFDYGIVDCVHELLFNRTHLGQDDHPLNLTFYENQPYVKYHKNRLNPSPEYRLDCSYGLSHESTLRYQDPPQRNLSVHYG